MAKLFQQKPAGAPAIPPRQMLMNKYSTARWNLLGAVIFTAINLFLLLSGANSYFLFSIYLPYFLGGMGMLLCGKFPPEFYEGLGEVTFLDTSVLVVMMIVAVVILGLYLLAFFMSKKKSGWLIAALVLFSIDSALMLLLGDFASSILDIVFHAWVIYYLIVGITSANKLKNMPEEEPEAVVAEGEEPIETEDPVEESATENGEPDAWAELNARVENSDETKE
ncbi:MAG: hypothetical protein E7625_06140 [Ruminococcaceae bacterium]|nr:hypothetical protein [Oscillospiraceae bacterium]